MQDYSLPAFSPHTGSTFQVVAYGQPALELTLAEVEDLSVEDDLRDPNIRSQPFSLIFHGPMSPLAQQGVYDLTHAALGSLSLFLVPLGPGRKTPQFMQYQAIFN
ncbi:MAG: hypothetical protein JSS49_24970 [Planctomycetes bacterium]|nr:hypothetical protein [Planctomycetota bacterium]